VSPEDGAGYMQGSPAENLQYIEREIDAACKIASADGAKRQVTITAVSKKHDVARIILALEAGHQTFGENRVQEALNKWPALREQYTELDLRLIGPLQSNKTREAVAFFNTIETVDRPKIAQALADEIQKQGKAPELFVQVNTGEEEQKSGIAPNDVDAFLVICREEYQLPIAGLMCIPPALAVPAPHFSLLRKIGDRNGLQKLSMGMSNDYIDAVKLGATSVRIGTGIFGQRPG